MTWLIIAASIIWVKALNKPGLLGYGANAFQPVIK
jgi:hypothetical protein